MSDEYAFKHILIRNVAYGQVPKGRRVVLHVRFWIGSRSCLARATSLSRSSPGIWNRRVDSRARWHAARSSLPSSPRRELLANAAGRAERREGLREAFRYYTRALDVLGNEYPERQLELRLRRSDIRMMLGELKEACDELLEVVEVASSSGNAQVECEGLLLLGDIDQRQGRAAEAHRRLAAAEALAARAGIPYLRIKVAFVLGALLADFDGRYDGAIEGLRNAIAISKEVDERPLTAEGHLRLSAIFINRGELAAAEEELRRCLELASELGSHRVEAEATSWLGMVVYQRGEIAEGERLCLQARQWLERTADTYFQVQNLVRGLAIFALDQGQPERAEEWLREAVPVALQIGGWVVVETYRYLIEALIDQGRLEDAQELLAFAARGLPEEDPYARSSLLLAEAIVATAVGESVSAATAFSEALRLIEELDMPMELGDARMALGRSLRAFGDVQGARTELMRARTTFARIGASTRLDALDGELADLTAHTAQDGTSSS